MKRFRLLTILFCFLCAFSLISSSGGRAAAAGQGNTGAPGDDPKVCSACHSGGNFGTTVAIKVKDSGDTEISEYSPGETYTVEVTISTSSTPNAYGFQMVSLKNADDTDVNAWSDPAGNTKIASAMGRSYAEHDGPSTSNTFSVKWTAPDQGSGSVSFYAAGNAVNLNGSTNGDAANTTSLTIGEGMTSSTAEITFDQNSLKAYPNPTANFVRLDVDFGFNGNMEIYSTTGKKIGSWTIVNGYSEADISQESAGTYVVTVLNEEGERVSTRKLIKI